MNKMSLIERYAVIRGITVVEASKQVNALLDTMARELVEGDGSIAITGFGVIERIQRNARFARNPQTGETVEVPPKVTVRFRPGQSLIDMLNGVKKMPAFGKSAIEKAPKYSLTPGKRETAGELNG